jgi:uncharacterized protein YndB with AHSA1/START domain
VAVEVGGASVVEREIRIDALPETVFAFLTDPEKVVRWMGTEATLDPRPGGIYRVNVTGRSVVRGEIVEVVHPERLIFTWGWEGEVFPVTPGSSTVEISVVPDGDGTVVHLTHRDLPGDMRPFHGAGWQHALGRLAVAAAGGDPGPDPLTSLVRGPRMAMGHLPWRYFFPAFVKMLVHRARGGWKRLAD